MSTFVMIGKYAADSLGAISAARTASARAIVEANGGKLKAAYALLGESDVLLIADLPGVEAAIQSSVALSKELGIAFNTSPALAAEAFDSLVG